MPENEPVRPRVSDAELEAGTLALMKCTQAGDDDGRLRIVDMEYEAAKWLCDNAVDVVEDLRDARATIAALTVALAAARPEGETPA